MPKLKYTVAEGIHEFGVLDQEGFCQKKWDTCCGFRILRYPVITAENEGRFSLFLQLLAEKKYALHLCKGAAYIAEAKTNDKRARKVLRDNGFLRFASGEEWVIYQRPVEGN